MTTTIEVKTPYAIKHKEVNVMFLFHNASDDQIALIGCLVALAGSMGIMYVSYFIGPAVRQNREAGGEQATRPFASRSTTFPSEAARDRAA